MARKFLGFLFLLVLPMASVWAEPPRLSGSWQRSKLEPARESFLIKGTGLRNNPLRQQLKKPFAEQELFVRFSIRYAAESIDTPENGDGEFFVLWLDAVNGGDSHPHAANVPNVGLHVNSQFNQFMVRFGPPSQVFAKQQLVGNRTFQVVARLRKSKPGPAAPFDRLALWIDPRLTDREKPHAQTSSKKGPASIQWIGFATGRKTEPTDRITIADLSIATSWPGIFDLPDVKLAKIKTTPVPPPKKPRKTVAFRRDIFPILQQRCFSCHHGNKAEVRLDQMDEMLNHTSALLKRVQAQGDERMPPPGEGRQALTGKEVTLLATWIREGLDWDEKLLPTPQPKTEHWSFQPIQRPQVPQPRSEAWVRTPVDAFVASAHETRGLAPSPLADGITLQRRIALDMTGLPPSRIDDRAVAPEALHKLLDEQVEKLLKSPRYAERWARHWLDVARFAESNGHQHNRNRPHAWRYRDYVVASFQNNKPFNQFLTEQIAGDELLPFNKQNLVATGFLAATRYSGNELDKEIQRNDILVDVVNATSQAFMGLTVGCAQCHTHKFDPISIRDYYRLQAFFAQGQPTNVLLTADKMIGELVDIYWALFDKTHNRLVKQKRDRGQPDPILITPSTVMKQMSAEDRRSFTRIQRELKSMDQSWAWYSPTTSPLPVASAPHDMRWPLPRRNRGSATIVTYLRVRGDVKSHGSLVEPGWPRVFGTSPQEKASSRRDLAAWLTSKAHPLTARVWVNRIWQWHFGRGLVATSDNFGSQGAEPTHPQLLDWLASELIDSGWDTNHIHKLILHSNTYRQSARLRQDMLKHDPENRFLWRWNVRRLEAEAIRDSLLAVAGMLDNKTGGPPVIGKTAELSKRRTIYLHIKRDNISELFRAFDGPNNVTSCARRRVSTVPTQALYLMNSKLAQQASAALAERVKRAIESPDDWAAQAIRMVVSRQPSTEEVAQAQQLLKKTSLESLCLALLNLSEFMYIP